MAKFENAPSTPKDTVTIRLPLTKTEKNDAFVGLNGTTYLIQRGVAVDVPRGVAKILENREKMLAKCIEFDAEFAGGEE